MQRVHPSYEKVLNIALPSEGRLSFFGTPAPHHRNGGSIYSGVPIQLPDLLDELKMARTKGVEAFNRLRKQFIKYDLLIIDEWLLFPISVEDTQLLLSLVDRRHNHQATIIASQFEPAEWLDQIPVPVAAEAITDRLCSQAYRIVIKGKKSMREAARD